MQQSSPQIKDMDSNRHGNVLSLHHLRKRHASLCALPMVERMEPQRKATRLRALTTPPRLFTCATKFLEKLRKRSLPGYRNE